MKKIRILFIFGLGIVLGILFQQIFFRYQEIRSPLLQQHSFDLEALINSVGDVVHAEKYSIVDDKYDRFEEVSALLDEAYFDQEKLQSGHMIEEALKAYVDAVEDPYTVYMDATTQSGFDASLKGTEDFEGIGAVVRKKEYYVLIEEVLKDSPAFKAGLKPLDRIIAVDSGSVKDLDINQAVDKIKGPKGSEVTLTIERVSRTDESKKEYFDQKVVREKLIIPSVTAKVLTLNDQTKVGYIDIAMIGEETEAIFQREIQLLKDQGVQGIILDLRGNGGGYLTVGVEIISHFVPKDEKVVSAKYRIRPAENYLSEGYGDLENYPVVVLMDDMTASAGEIIAMALQEQIGAKLVGTTTFGKGSIQTMEVYKDGASLKYTIGKRYSPSGKNIDNVGVKPDVEVELDIDKYIAEDVDTQLEAAKKTISEMIK